MILTIDEKKGLVGELKARLAADRERLKTGHDSGAGGWAVAHGLAESVDGVLIELFARVTKKIGLGSPDDSRLAIVALGGYGRGALAPYSDVDLLFLLPDGGHKDETLMRKVHEVIAMLWDLGFDVGHSVRSIDECVSNAKADLIVFTSMLESRLIAGGSTLYREFQTAFRKKAVGSDPAHFIGLKSAESVSRHKTWHDTVFLTEPNVKESPGGLRDYHSAVWASLARFGIGKPGDMLRRGLIDEEEHAKILKAHDFILRLRNSLHYAAGRKTDLLDHGLQPRIAANLGYAPQDETPDRHPAPESLLDDPVNRLMRDYFESAWEIYEFGRNILSRCRRYSFGVKSAIERLRSRRLEHGLAAGSSMIYIPGFDPDFFKRAPFMLAQVFRTAQLNALALAPDLKRQIARNASVLYGWHERPADRARIADIFLRILRHPDSAATIRSMYETGIFTKLLPEFAQIEYLTHSDLYHRFSVDEHTIRSIAMLESLDQTSDKPALFDIYRSDERPEIVKMALICHDIAKHIGKKHPEAGAKQAEAILARFGWEDIAEQVSFLVLNHLRMSEAAQRLDPHEERTIADFCAFAGTREKLQRLYLLTFADIAAVAPNMWTAWREKVLFDLYNQSERYFSAGYRMFQLESERAEKLKSRIAEISAGTEFEKTAREFVKLMPERYFADMTEESAMEHIKFVRDVPRGTVRIRHMTARDKSEARLTVCAPDKPGTFAKIAGVLTAKDFNIRSAEIVSRADGLALDTLHVTRPGMQDIDDSGLWARLEGELSGVLLGEKSVEELMQRRTRLVTQQPDSEPARGIPTRVSVLNEIADAYSVVEVTTLDRMGVLYAVTNAIFRLGLNIHQSRIFTEGKRAVNVHHVTNPDSGKIDTKESKAELVSAIKSALAEITG